MGTEIHDIHTYVWDSSVLQVIRRARSDLHRHGALQLTLGVERPLRMGGDTVDTLQGRAILVAADQPHWFESDGWAAALWLEPQSRPGRALAQRYLADATMAVLPEGSAADLWTPLLTLASAPASLASASALRERIVAAWIGDAGRAPPLHPALQRATRAIAGLDEVRVSAAELAETVGISESRLLHLFGEQLGIPLRRFVLWCRVRRAILALAEGANATQAAHVAGFHDSAHLTRTFKSLLAVPPREVAKLRGHFSFPPSR